jgi:hypothetical protein
MIIANINTFPLRIPFKKDYFSFQEFSSFVIILCVCAHH